VREDLQKWVHAVYSYLEQAQTEFLLPQDFYHLRGQDNILRHLAVGRLAVCVHPEDSLFETAARVAAGVICGCQVVLSWPAGLENSVTRFLNSEEGHLLTQQVQVLQQDEAQLIAMVPQVERLRYAAAHRVPEAVYAAAAQAGVYIARTPVLMDGRVELLHYLLGQAVCDTYHRHGNLGERGLKRGWA
jgi:RHH-type proline utilization regulon transcriptional repressor/proline dehydrogenase/delta 1-pyrroline-5-carboxylate dehydrogenase